MARKKKKQVRKKQVQQRKAAKAQKRQKRRKKTSPARSAASAASDGPSQDLMDDMLVLFPKASASLAPPEESMQPLMEAIFDSEELMEEPEFDDLVLPPLECVQIFIQEARERGLSPDMIPDLSEEEREDAYLNAVEEVSKAMMNDELRLKMIDRVDALRLRWKQKWFGKKKKVAQAAAVQAFLQQDDKDSREIWPVMGLTLALVDRSVQAGFALSAAAADLADSEELTGEDDLLALSEKISQSPAGKSLETLIKRAPGLDNFFEEQADEMWEAGQLDAFTGDLFLGLFEPEELENGLAIFQETIMEDISEEDQLSEDLVEELLEEHGETLIIELDAYLMKQFTPERFEQYRKRLAEVSREPDQKDWLQFIFMLIKDAEGEDGLESSKPFLVSAFMGEIMVAGGVGIG